ncbi:MAG TPA: sugar phosphate isomerase/epimerase family protein [Planctomicrobium sp.]|nr:sugar phosphate isomerase/epimerase family protein [Planctomicrobium sp.]
MIQSAVTVSLVPQARSGPFVFHDDLPGSIRCAAELGYDAVELFLPGPDSIDPKELQTLLDETGLKVAAVGTGAGMVMHQLSLSDADSSRRSQAIEFVTGMIQFGGEFGAPAIIGSMQGRWTPATGKEQGSAWLAESLRKLSEKSGKFDVPLIYEPLNRYETNFCNRLADGVSFLKGASLENVLLLADLFHMNIEESDSAKALVDAGQYVGHVHFVDSNRRPAGNGQLNFTPILVALKEIGYEGYLSAEAFPWPDSETAARTTIQTLRGLLGPSVSET